MADDRTLRRPFRLRQRRRLSEGWTLDVEQSSRVVYNIQQEGDYHLLTASETTGLTGQVVLRRLLTERLSGE
jgi:hypothetical protein